MKREEILIELQKNGDFKYKAFQKKLIPNIEEDKIIGVRIPLIRKQAMELRDKEPQKIIDQFLSLGKKELYYEEKVLIGCLIGYMKISMVDWKNNIEKFVDILDNWAVCDTTCSTMKIVYKNKKEVWEFLQSFLMDSREYHIRFGVVMLMDYFIEEEYIEKVIDVLQRVYVQDYYAMMAVAWALSVCFVKFEDKTMELINSCNLDRATHNKTIQKIRESNRVSNEKKDKLLKFKR